MVYWTYSPDASAAFAGDSALCCKKADKMSSFRKTALFLLSVGCVLLVLNKASAQSTAETFLPYSLSSVPQAVVSLITRFWEIFGPGGEFHPTAFIESKGHLVLEGLLILVILYLFLQKSFNPSFQKNIQAELSEQVSLVDLM